MKCGRTRNEGTRQDDGFEAVLVNDTYHNKRLVIQKALDVEYLTRIIVWYSYNPDTDPNNHAVVRLLDASGTEIPGTNQCG
jgi:hypothetical protein